MTLFIAQYCFVLRNLL